MPNNMGLSKSRSLEVVLLEEVAGIWSVDMNVPHAKAENASVMSGGWRANHPRPAGLEDRTKNQVNPTSVYEFQTGSRSAHGTEMCDVGEYLRQD